MYVFENIYDDGFGMQYDNNQFIADPQSDRIDEDIEASIGIDYMNQDRGNQKEGSFEMRDASLQQIVNPMIMQQNDQGRQDYIPDRRED